MSWLAFQTEAHWIELLEASQTTPQLLFKHSTRC